MHVARQLADALKAAHAAGIIHRDVKPQNILLPKAGEHYAWLGDFGICLIRDLKRTTDEQEKVGPVYFMAPELEGGGRLEVTSAADVYSLGKVIYYMLSGGVVLPREEWHDDEYAAIFKRGGQQQQLFQIMLAKMVCPLKNRFRSMDDVLEQLEPIQSWARDATLLPVSHGFLANWQSLEEQAIAARQAAEEKADAATRRQEFLRITQQGTLAWLQNELESAASLMQGGLITVGVRSAAGEVPAVSNYRPQSSVELWTKLSKYDFNREHVLRFSFCVEFTVRFGGGNPPEHSNVGVLPTYGQSIIGGQPKRQPSWYLLTPQNGIQAIPINVVGQPGFSTQRRRVVPQPQQTQAQLLHFSTMQWPDVSTSLPDFFKRAMDTFVLAMRRGVPAFPV